MSKLLGAGAAILLMGAAGVARAQVASAPEAALFGARESATSVHLSPDGNSVAFLAPAPGGAWVPFTANIATGESKPFLRPGKGTDKLHWCRFVTDQRLICRYGGIARNSEGVLLGYSRLIAINRDWSEMKQLGQSSSFYDAGIRQ